MSSFSREELIALRERAREMSQVVLNPSWKRAYQDLAHAACVLDAFIARSTKQEGDLDAIRRMASAGEPLIRPEVCCGGKHDVLGLFQYVRIQEQEKEDC